MIRNGHAMVKIAILTLLLSAAITAAAAATRGGAPNQGTSATKDRQGFC